MAKEALKGITQFHGDMIDHDGWTAPLQTEADVPKYQQIGEPPLSSPHLSRSSWTSGLILLSPKREQEAGFSLYISQTLKPGRSIQSQSS